MDKETLTIAPVAVSCGADAEFIDLAGLERQFNIRRSTAYTLISEGAIRSVVLRRPGKIKGRRLVDVTSVRSFLASQPSEIDPRMKANAQKAQIKSAEAKRKKKEQAMA
jgi:hypothetical protein